MGLGFRVLAQDSRVKDLGFRVESLVVLPESTLKAALGLGSTLLWVAHLLEFALTGRVLFSFARYILTLLATRWLAFAILR